MPTTMSPLSNTFSSNRQLQKLPYLEMKLSVLEKPLDLNRLENWLVEMEKRSQQPQNKKHTRPTTTELKNAIDVLTFLNSPAGLAIKGMICQKIAELTNLQLLRQMHLQQAQLQDHLKTFFLLSSLMHRWKNKQSQKLWQEEEKRIVNKQRVVSQPSSSSGVNHYYTTIAFQEHLEKVALQLDQYGRKLATLEKHSLTIEARYKAFDLSLLELDSFIKSGLTTEKPALKNLMLTLNQQLELEAQKLNRLVEQNQDDEASNLLHTHNARHLLLAGLNDLLAVQEQRKNIFNHLGKPVTSFEEASFILEINKKIIYDNGHYYLVKSHQDLDSLTLEDRASAQKDYEHARSEILSLKNLVVYNKELEISNNQAQILELKKSLTILHDHLREFQAVKVEHKPEPRPVPNFKTLLMEVRSQPENKEELENGQPIERTTMQNLSKHPEPSPTPSSPFNLTPFK